MFLFSRHESLSLRRPVISLLSQNIHVRVMSNYHKPRDLEQVSFMKFTLTLWVTTLMERF
jgi:hypothetical protein